MLLLLLRWAPDQKNLKQRSIVALHAIPPSPLRRDAHLESIRVARRGRKAPPPTPTRPESKQASARTAARSAALGVETLAGDAALLVRRPKLNLHHHHHHQQHTTTQPSVSDIDVYASIDNAPQHPRPRIVVLGSGWAGASFFKALPEYIK